MVARRRIGEIQWLRAVAALMVVAAHIQVSLDLRAFDGPAVPSDRLSWLLAGVDVFFVISGFVMAYASAELHGNPGAWRRFLVRRLARVVPLYWLMTLMLIALMIAIRSENWAETTVWQIAASFLFFPAANIQGVPLPLLDLGWTLNYEMMFYVVFALFVGLRQTAALFGTAAFLVAAVLLGRIVPMPTLALRVWTDPVVLEFVGGIGVFLLFRRGLTLSPAARLGLVALALAVFALVPLHGIAERALVWGVPACLLVLAAVSGSDRSPSSLGQWAGDLSYAIYLSHFFVIRTVLQLFERIGIQSHAAWVVGFPLLVVGGTLAASAVLHHGFEKPMLRGLRRRFDRGLATGAGAEPGP